MDGDGSLVERRVFTVDSSHHFSQHGLLSTLNRVGDSFAQQSRLQSLRQVHRLQGAKLHAGSLTNAEVLRWLKLVPTHLELQVRRLRWCQTILMDRECNEALLGIFLGRQGVEVEGALPPKAHPWVLQLEIDLQSLTDIEPGKDFILAWQGNLRKLVLDEECRTLFCDIDLHELRMRALYDVECPTWQLAHLRDSTEMETDRSMLLWYKRLLDLNPSPPRKTVDFGTDFSLQFLFFSFLFFFFFFLLFFFARRCPCALWALNPKPLNP